MKFLLLWLSLFVQLTWAQLNPPNPIQYVTADPTGNACSAISVALRTPNGILYTCQGGTYAAASGNATTINGGAVPASARILGSNASSQPVDNGATFIYPCNGSGTTTQTCTSGYSRTLVNGDLVLWKSGGACGTNVTLNFDGNGALDVYGMGAGQYLNYCPVGVSNLLIYNSSGWFESYASVINQCGVNGSVFFYQGAPDRLMCGSTNTNLTTGGVLSIRMFQGYATAPTLGGACSTTLGTGSKNASGFFTTTTTGACAITLTMSSASTTGVVCIYRNATTVANQFNQTSDSTTVSTASGTTVSGDKIYYHCIGY